MEPLVRDVHDLKLEIRTLKNIEAQQMIALKERFSGPSAIFATAMTLFPKSAATDGIRSASFFHQDFLGLLSRFVLPLTLNKTLFRNSNFIVKAIVGLLSQKASNYISEDSVAGVWDKAKNIFNNFTKKKDHKQEHFEKEVIPAYSQYYKEEK